MSDQIVKSQLLVAGVKCIKDKKYKVYGKYKDEK